ncbi:hypothetical protein OC25_06560 [Pedobacter kyungheensis]|uniref:DUF4249 domain-containing protein n=1 Tax=Pedobacter kyungheensis TaxID=1069985 RepID=A0A0C1G5W6_9SPHI|nr:DUF4249 family protein [Pedobacter kyungheensis]KIA95494.1 hypothetical protein OC25_06560 [Pedobacter kyungheensis]
MEIKTTAKQLLFLLIVTLTYVACKKDEGDSTIAGRPIIEAYLINDKAVSLKVYEQKGLLDTASYGAAITGLNITFSNGAKTITLNETANGVYTSTATDLVVPGNSCSFNFNYNGKVISGETTVPAKPVAFASSSSEQGVPNPDPDSSSTAFTAVNFTWNNSNKGYYLMVFRNQDDTPNRIGSGFGRRNAYEDREEYLGQVSAYKTQRMTFQFSGYYDVYLYHINPEYNNILNSSSNSSLNLTNPPTNIKNGLGIFTAMACDSLLLHVYEQ